MGLVRAFRAAVTGREPEREPLQRPVSCTSCGRTYNGPGAHQVAHEDGRCLPEHVTEGLLVPVDGVYVLRGSDAALK